ncbi:unnamed protein product [Paramecium pentaurelia]|uniref:Uncharacterized protein n=1 Tax=Paramecium pentaurelia TaxID=43138 RepID=A0A8S1TT87_9CILI|nr:unnamed protein product [Paramecium pentaurelia]
MVQLDIEGVQENITFSLLESDTIKDIKTQLNDYLKQKKRPELKYIEIYKDSILQNDETITIFQLFKQPYIEVKSTSKNHENKNPNQISEKQQIEMQQNDFNIQSEIQLLKELFDTKLKNLQLLFMKMLNDSRNIIFKELEFLERDITQIQQLFKQPFNQQQLSQLIKSKQTLYNQQKQISQEHIQKLQSEFENFKQNLQKEQQKLQEKQRNCFEMVKIEMQTSIQSFQVDEQKVLRQTKILTDEEVTFEELIKYLEQTFPVEIKKYTQTLGPLRQWVGLSENKEKEVKLKEIVYNHQNELIKFGPIHIDIKSKQQQSSAIDINITLYELKNE